MWLMEFIHTFSTNNPYTVSWQAECYLLSRCIVGTQISDDSIGPDISYTQVLINFNQMYCFL